MKNEEKEICTLVKFVHTLYKLERDLSLNAEKKTNKQANKAEIYPRTFSRETPRNKIAWSTVSKAVDRSCRRRIKELLA